MKRIVAVLLFLAMCLCLSSAAFADAAAGDQRITMGADLTAEQRVQVYKDFGVEAGSIAEITITNADERAVLAGIVDEKKIGSVALSCTYITVLEPGQGLTVLTNNINYCTAEMYRNALTTVGITDARVVISAPFAVSGTGALTGIYRAYEELTGLTISEIVKEAGAEELVLTGELAEYMGSDDATALINELKLILDQTQNMTDAEVLEQIDLLAAQYNVSLTDTQKNQILKLCRSLEKLDVESIKEKLISLTDTVQKVAGAKDAIDGVVEKASGFMESVKQFFANVADFFKGIFGG